MSTSTTINPYTEKSICEYTLLTTEETSEAVNRAHKTYQTWKLKTIEQRCEPAMKFASLLRDNSKSLAKLMTDEMGKPLEQGLQEIELCATICEYTCDTASKELATEEREFENGRALVAYQPIGVILGIQPWNFPLYQVIRYSITNLVAGNTTVLKHAANVFGMAERIQSLYEEAGFPKYAYQSLMIDGDAASELISHEFVRGVTFTGSDVVGKKVGEQAASLSKKTVLELGSNDAFLVLDDADIEVAVKACVTGRVINNGETCVSAKRFIVTEKNYDAFKKAFTEAMSNLKVGDPNNTDMDLGPMARKDLRDELHEQVQESIEKGAKVVCGCEVPQKQGYFYPPSILENVTPGMPAYDDELFGPVASLIKAKDDNDAIRIANDSRYGLGGGIFSTDENKAIDLAIKHFDTGMVNINGYALAQPNLPFGGVKSSGYGREHGGFGLKEFVNTKTVMIAESE